MKPYLAQESLHTGEFIVNLINTGTSWDVTIKMTAVGPRWDGNYELTTDYETASVNVSSSMPSETVVYFDHVLTRDAGMANPVYAIGLYKVSAFENGVEQSYFFYDCRTSDWSASVDSYFAYDVLNNRFRNSANTTTIDYTIQTLWDLTGNNLETTGLESYWTNSLNMIDSGDGNPRIVWGPYPTQYLQIQKYKIYRAVTNNTIPPQTPVFYLLDEVNSSTTNYTDEDFVIGGINNVHYKVTALVRDLEVLSIYETSATNNVVTAGSLYKEGNKEELVKKTSLHYNYPNPFNPTTNINYHLNKSGQVKLIVFNSIGEEITTLVDKHQSAGEHSISVDLNDFPSGIYFYRIETSGFTNTKKMILLR